MLLGSNNRALVHVCIHGHFYQPPRENPFTNEVPQEIGAEPYNNFNEKITAECYRPNAELDNFQHISFNFGPTLAAWIEKHEPETYRRIIEADKANYAKYGYGNALAQVYNHVIMPLARPQDARMQILWGIADFERRFGHTPEGMWLAETAVNSQVLEMMADAGIKFTILAPWQAKPDSVETIDPAERGIMQERLRTRVISELSDSFQGDPRLRHAALKALERANIPELFDANEPYMVELRNGRSIAVFFYNGPISGGVSFDQSATVDADGFVRQWILPQVSTERLSWEEPQLITIATDGELYGHHQSYRDFFLQRLTTYSVQAAGMNLTFPSKWLRENPPRCRVQIVEDTSWSCFHGVKRWGCGCDCTPGDTSWKDHLRKAFDILSDEVDRIFLVEGYRLFLSPQDALRDWLSVWLGAEKEKEFAARHLRPQASPSQARRLLQAQIYKHQMYTSCAWFFEDIDRIEPKNALAAAAITFRLLGRWVAPQVRPGFERELACARSNRKPANTGLQLYRRGARQSLVTQTEKDVV